MTPVCDASRARAASVNGVAGVGGGFRGPRKRGEWICGFLVIWLFEGGHPAFSSFELFS